MKKIVSYFLVALFFVAGSAGYLVYLQLTDLENLKTTLAHKIGEITQSEVSISEVELNFNQGIGVRLKDVSIGKSANGTAEMQAKEVLVVIKIFPLFFRELVIKKMVMRGSSIKLTRGTDGRFKVLGVERLLARKKPVEESFFSMAKMSFIPQLMIQESEIEFRDYYKRTEPLRIPIKNIRFSIQRAFAEPRFEFSLQGEIPNSRGNSRLTVFGNLQNTSGDFNLSGLSVDGKITLQEIFLPQFEPYLQKLAVLNLGDISISLESRFAAALNGPMRFTGNLQYGSLAEGNASTQTKPSKSYRGEVDYKVIFQEGDLTVEEVSFRSGNFSVKGDGHLTGYASKNPHVSFVMRSDKLSEDDIDVFFLFKLLSEEQQKFARKTLDKGAVEIISLKFNGNLEQLRHLDTPENMALLSCELAFKKVKWDSPFLDLDNVSGVFRVGSGESDIDINEARHKLFPLANLTGKITNLTNGPVGDLRVDGALTLRQLKKILKTGITDERFRQSLDRLQDISGKGKVRLSFKGPLGNINQVSTSAHFLFDKASLKGLSATDKNKSYSIKNLRGKISLEHKKNQKAKTTHPWKLSFDGFSGNFDTNSFSDMEGEIRLGKEEPIFKMTSKVQIDATQAKSLIELPSLPFWEEADFRGGMFLMDYRGEGRSLDFKRVKPNVAIELKNISMKFGEQPTLWSNLSGRMVFAENKTRLEEVRGRYGNSPFNLNGDIETRPKSDPKFKFHLTSPALSMADLQDFPFLKQLKGEGSVQVDSHWNGTPKAIEFQGAMNLKKTYYNYEDILVKDAGTANSIRLKGRIEKHKTIIIQQLAYVMGNNKIKAEGRVQLAPKSRFTFRVHAADLQSASLGLLPLKNNRSGKIHFDVSGAGSLNKPSSTSFKGNLDFDKLTFEIDGKPFTFSAKAQINGKKLDIQKGRLTFADTSLRFKGLYGLGASPVFDLVVSGKKLNMNRLWRNSETQPIGFRGHLKNSRLFNQGTGRLVFNLKRFDYKFWRLKEISGEISLKKKLLQFNKLKIVSPNNNLIRGHGTLALPKSGGSRFQTLIYAKNIQVDDFLGQFGNVFGDSLSGKVKLLQANFQGEGSNWNEIVRSLDGTLSFGLFSGRIDRKKLSQGVLYVMGLSKGAKPSKKQEPPSKYERISGRFLVRKGVARTENFLYKTSKRVTSLVGKLDLTHSKMDTVIGVAPLAALDKFLTRIPLVGKIITAGDEESLFKSYYTVRGKFTSPKITPVPFTSLEKKVVGIFQGILQTPRDILLPRP